MSSKAKAVRMKADARARKRQAEQAPAAVPRVILFVGASGHSQGPIARWFRDAHAPGAKLIDLTNDLPLPSSHDVFVDAKRSVEDGRGAVIAGSLGGYVHKPALLGYPADVVIHVAQVTFNLVSLENIATGAKAQLRLLRSGFPGGGGQLWSQVDHNTFDGVFA